MAKTDRPSRELDVRVAKALGWFGPVQWVDDESGRDPYMYTPDIPHRLWASDRAKKTGEHNHIVPWFSSRIQDAWQLMRWMFEHAYRVTVAHGEQAGWIVTVRGASESHGTDYIEDTAELALCAAFLDVVAEVWAAEEAQAT